MKIKKFIIVLMLLFMSCMLLGARELTKNEKIAVANLKDNIRNARVNSLVEQIEFPLHRSSYPDYSVKDPNEFVQMYSRIFDDNMIKEFLEAEWHYYYGKLMNECGFTGHFDDDGVLKIDRIPLSDSEMKYIMVLVNTEKPSLHSSVQDFIEPILLLKAGKYIVRLDYLNDHSIRYVCWHKGQKFSEKPQLVLYNGETYGNRYHDTYSFENNGYTYTIEDGAISTGFSVGTKDKLLLDFYDEEVELLVYPTSDTTFNRCLYMLATYSDEAMQEKEQLNQ